MLYPDWNGPGAPILACCIIVLVLDDRPGWFLMMLLLNRSDYPAALWTEQPAKISSLQSGFNSDLAGSNSVMATAAAGLVSSAELPMLEKGNTQAGFGTFENSWAWVGWMTERAEHLFFEAWVGAVIRLAIKIRLFGWIKSD